MKRSLDIPLIIAIASLFAANVMAGSDFRWIAASDTPTPAEQSFEDQGFDSDPSVLSSEMAQATPATTKFLFYPSTHDALAVQHRTDSQLIRAPPRPVSSNI